MNVLVVYAHHDPNSFTHAILESVTRGLDESPHTHKVSDLDAVGVNPVFTAQDSTQFLHESYPDHLLERTNSPQAVLNMAGGPIRRYVAQRWLRGKTSREIATALYEQPPDDVRQQQALVREADGLIFVAPVFWMGFPAILKGWFERVFA